jgi:hypothetical protein
MSDVGQKRTKKYTEEELKQVEQQVLVDFDSGMQWNALVEKYTLPRVSRNHYYLGNILNRNDRHRKVQNKVKRRILGVEIKDGTQILITFDTKIMPILNAISKKDNITIQQFIEQTITKETEKRMKEDIYV